MPRISKAPSNSLIKRITWRVGIYIRLSRDDGNDESFSVANQKKVGLDFLEHFEEEHVFVDFYIDDGRTGTDSQRPDFQRMISDIESGKLNCVVCKNLSRSFRNYADQGYYLESFFPLHQTRFISIGSPALDTYLNPEAIVDGMEVPITGLMNDRYAARTSQDIRRTFDAKRKRGEFIGSFAPYGYKKNPENKNHLLIDEEVAEIVRNIFHWYVNEGMSKLGITKHLNELGVMNPTKYKHSIGLKFNTPKAKKSDGMWSVSTVSSILRDRRYVGTMVQGVNRTISYKVRKTIRQSEEEWFVVENTHEAIIDAEVFEKAQLLNEKDMRVAPTQKRVYLFAGFVRCVDCNMGMRRKASRRTSRNGAKKEYVYYVCRTHSQKNKHKCTSHSIKHKLLTQLVLSAIQAQIALVANIADVVAEVNKQSIICDESSILEKQFKEKMSELDKITHTIDSLYMDWKCGDITKEDYARMKAKFGAKVEEIKSIIANIEAEIESNSQNIGEDAPYLKTFLKYQNIKDLTRGLLVELIDTIYIHENNEITIKFKFDKQYKRIMEFIEINQVSTEEIGV